MTSRASCHARAESEIEPANAIDRALDQRHHAGLLSEIVVRVDAEDIEMILHWQGGDHTALKLKKNGVGKHRWTIPADTLSLVRELARLMPDRQIARLLNRAGKPTGRGNGWTQARVCSFRSHHGIAVHHASEWA